MKKLKPSLFFCLLIFLFSVSYVFALDKRLVFSLSHYIMAGIHETLGEIEEAIGEYKNVLKLDSQSILVHLNLASSYIKNNEIQKAIQQLNLAIAIEPEAVEPHAILALLYSAQGKTEEANHEFEIALKNASKLQPKNIDIYKVLGQLYLRQKNFKAAEETYRLILNISSQDAEAYFYLGNIYDQLKDRAKTEEMLKEALKLKPDYAEALNYLGYLYVEEDKKLDEAEIMIKKALEIEPDNGAYIDSLGWLYFKKAKYKEALKELERAITLLEDPVIYDHLAEVYFKLGDLDNAKLNWQKSLELDPQQDKVKEKLEKLK